MLSPDLSGTPVCSLAHHLPVTPLCRKTELDLTIIDAAQVKKLMATVVDILGSGLRKVCRSPPNWGRGLWRPCADMLAYFDVGVSDEPAVKAPQPDG